MSLGIRRPRPFPSLKSDKKAKFAVTNIQSKMLRELKARPRSRWHFYKGEVKRIVSDVNWPADFDLFGKEAVWRTFRCSRSSPYSKVRCNDMAGSR